MSIGTLYSVIELLLDQGWIRRVDEPIPNSTKPRRRTILAVVLAGGSPLACLSFTGAPASKEEENAIEWIYPRKTTIVQ